LIHGPEDIMSFSAFSIEALLVSTGIVALAEIGDKTQLLAFMLAARYRRAGPIVLGILVATIANHAFAGAVGTWITSVLLAMAAWTLIPDKLDAGDVRVRNGMGVFMTTTIAFFLAEMGDKTQIATVALAAQYEAFVAVVLGTTLGMMIANVPAVLVGDRLAHRMPVRLVHAIAAAIFGALGVVALSGAWQG
jgi:Ca2+/H+ antiporter, TMEM165/GDT1 family